MNFKPLFNNILVERIEEQNATKGGIIIPDTAKEKPSKGKVLSIGDGAILENGNKFSHKKMVCGLAKEVKENLIKELNTNFNDIENLTFAKDVKNLENVKVVVWTSKNTFENREITKSELLGMALKANCYDVSGLDWQETVKKIWLENGIISDKNFSVNEKITKNEAFDIILKAGQIVTPKDSAEEAMKFLWVINNKNITSENLFREQAVNIFVNILKLYK